MIGQIFAPVQLSLEEFIENWCIGMSNDHLMVGTNFDSNMFGYEADPLKLIIDISNELKTLGQPVKLLK